MCYCKSYTRKLGSLGSSLICVKPKFILREIYGLGIKIPDRNRDSGNSSGDESSYDQWWATNLPTSQPNSLDDYSQDGTVTGIHHSASETRCIDARSAKPSLVSTENTRMNKQVRKD